MNPIRRWLFPARCALCGRVISGGGLCPACTADYPPVVFHRSLYLDEIRSFRCVGLYSYANEAREAICRMKFGGERGRAEGFGILMAQLLQQKPQAELITFVPMDRAKQAVRGYNQAQLLAQGCARSAGIPCRAVLHKTRTTRTQHELTAEQRRANASGAYRSEPLHGERVVLCDDIITTGETMRACAQALLDAGAGCVTGICAGWSGKQL